MKGSDLRKHWYIPVLALLIVSTGILSEQGADKNLVLIPVAAAFLLGFGVLLGVSVKEWKKSDVEVLAGFSELAAYFTGGKEVSLRERQKRFLAALGVAGFALVRTRDRHSLIFLGIVVLLFGVPLLMAMRSKGEKKERLVKPETIAALILGLLPTGFMCAFMGIGVYHGVWWFVCPPGLIFLSFFSRPLVAALRTLLKVPAVRRDRGEGHVKQGKETDPWDRPDRDMDRYRRK